MSVHPHVPPAPPKWDIKATDMGHVLTVDGDWMAQSGSIPIFSPADLKAVGKGQPLAFDMKGIGRWDTGLVAFLWDVKRASAATGVVLATNTLPNTASELLRLLPERLAESPSSAPEPAFRPLATIGAATINLLSEIGDLVILSATTVKGGVYAVLGRSRLRGVDLLADLRDAGPSALVIVGVVNFLVGAILAFVGAAQLKKFAAGAYVANLVGIAMVREMTAIITAIVMAGRTGGAYAARIATMEGGEEIDALKVIGIPVSDYLILPAVLSLVFTMPILYLYGCLIGLLGGFIVTTTMLDVSGASYLGQTVGAVAFNQFVFGFVKSIAFALLIGVTSCRIGLKAGRSSADVGTAATKAVVVGIVGIISLDALFAVAANAVGI